MILAVVQARMGSTRFPGKMMVPAWRTVPLVGWVLDRARLLRADGVVLATTRLPEDDVLTEVAEVMSVPVHRGEINDVAARLRGACDAHRCRREDDVVLRICGDSPLWDPREVHRVIDHLVANPWASRVLTRMHSATQGVDVMLRSALDEAYGEHLLADGTQARTLVLPGRVIGPMTIDTPEDLERLRPLIEEDARARGL